MKTLKLGQKFRQPLPLYPLILGIYPVLFLWLANFSQVPVNDILGTLALSIGLSVFVFLCAGLVFRKRHKAAAAAGLFLALFFFYGHFYNLVMGWKLFGLIIGTPPITLGLWALLFLGGMLWIARTSAGMVRVTWLFNRVSSFLVVLTLAQLAVNFLMTWTTPIPQNLTVGQGAPAAITPPLDANLPDIYYFVLDGYDRQDLLKEDTGIDNQPFLTQLEEMGFVVPACTQSNYNTTTYSVAATLNMNYIDQILGISYANLAAQADLTVEKSTPALVAAIQSNVVMQQFKALGYQVVTLEQDFPFLVFPGSDIVLDRVSDTRSKITTLKFQTMFLKTTLLQRLIQNVEAAPENYNYLPGWFYELINPNITLIQKYQRDLFQLNKLEQVAQIPGKKFLYAHLNVTHPDFAFTPDGQLRESAMETKAAYGDQVLYTNQRMLEIIRNILAQSETPPIILLQGDHAYGYGGRGLKQVKILNAYYLPGDARSQIYPSITPVNTFRLILSSYFHKNYPPLPDQSMWVESDFAGGRQLIAGSCVQP